MREQFKEDKNKEKQFFEVTEKFGEGIVKKFKDINAKKEKGKGAKKEQVIKTKPEEVKKEINHLDHEEIDIGDMDV